MVPLPVLCEMLGRGVTMATVQPEKDVLLLCPSLGNRSLFNHRILRPRRCIHIASDRLWKVYDRTIEATLHFCLQS